MQEPPRRKRFQIRLSTAIVLMFTAGALIWANVSGQKIIVRDRSTGTTEYRDFFFHRYGWPATVTTRYPDYEDVPPQTTVGEVLSGRKFDYIAATCNIVSALAILVFIFFLCEYLIRRRATQKEL